MELIDKGAEANLYRDNDRLLKQRVSKKYRIKELDERLRRLRTRHESNLLKKLSDIGIDVPKLYESDEKEYKILMEYIDGKLIKNVFESESDPKIEELSRDIGKILADMHKDNIIHNDLTTSNMLLEDNKIYFIDLGLGMISTRIEDKAVDLVVLKKSLKASHPKKFDLIWNNIIKGYFKYDRNQEVFKRVEIIEKRVRYA